MARRLLLILAALGISIGVAWQFGLLGPHAGGEGEGPVVEPDAPGLATSAGDGMGEGAGPVPLAGGGAKPVARTKAPEVNGPRVTGRVTDRAGKPIRDAHVVSIPDTATKALALKDLGAEGCAAFDAVTDEQGKFVVGVAKDAPFHALIAEAAGFGAGMEGQVAVGADVTIVLDKAGTIFGTVTDGDGAPVVGARIRLLGLLDAYRLEFETKSGAGGLYRLEGFPAASARSRSGPNAYLTMYRSALEVSAEGFATVLTTGVGDVEPGKEKARDFVLTRGATLVGAVVDAETSKPIEGARVVLWSNEAAGALSVQRPGGVQLQNPYSPRTLAEASSGKDGAFQFDRLPVAGFHPSLSQNWGRRGQLTLGTVAGWKEGYCAGSDEVPLAKDGARIEVTLKLWPAGVLTGRVVQADGTPVEKASVYATVKDRQVGYLPKEVAPDGPSYYVPETGADGRFRLAGIPVTGSGSTDVKLVARLKRTGPTFEWKEDGDASATVTVKAGEAATAPDLVVKGGDGGTAVSVEITDAQGRPVWGASVEPDTWRGFGAGARTDADGRARVVLPKMPDAPPGQPALTLTARAKGYGPTPVPFVAGSTDLVRVTMKPAHRLTGRVLQADRTPAVGAFVQAGDGSLPIDQVFPEPGKDGRVVRSVPMPAGRSGAYVGFATTDDQGRFALEDLAEGPYHLMAMRGQRSVLPPGSRPAGRALLANVATDASEVELVLPVDESPPSGGVEGAVVDAGTGRPVPGLSVVLRRGEEFGGSAQQQRGGMMMPMGAAGGPTGTVPSPGRYEIPSAVAGTWALTASADGYRPKTVEGITVRPGDTTRVPTIALDRGTTVRGRVTVPEGATAPDRTLYFMDLSAEPGRERFLQADVAADGTFSQTGFTPGTWKVMSYKQGWSEKQEPPLVPARDERLEVHEGDSEVRFDVAFVISGTLTVQPSDDRLPPARWEGAVATDEQKRFGEACRIVVTDPQGAVVAEQKGIRRRDAGKVNWLQVLPGRYVVRMEMPGGESREETADVKAAGQATVTLARK